MLAYGLPSFVFTERPERHDLKQSVLVTAWFFVITNIADHILRHAVRSAIDIAEFVHLQNRVVRPWTRFTAPALSKYTLAFRGKIPVQIINTLSRERRSFHITIFPIIYIKFNSFSLAAF